MTFQSPWWLVALLAVVGLVGLYVLLQLRRARYAARFTNVALLGTLVPKRAGWRRHVAFGLVALGLGVLVVSLAAPSTEIRVPRERATVIMAVDVSLSMQATDIEPDRFSAMQVAAKEFVKVLPARINLGLVSFAGTATTHFQSTLDSTAEELPPARIVLLSDGYSTVGREATQAVDAANAAQVPVSTIAFGTDYGTLDLNGEQVPVPVDRSTLEQIADDTGGSYSEAATAKELEQVYEDLGSQIGYTSEPHDISPWFVRGGLLFAFLGIVASLLWTNRLL